MSIYYAKTDIGERMEYTDIFLPFIDGWAVCDGVCATIRLKKDERDRFWEYAVKRRFRERNLSQDSALWPYSTILWMRSISTAYSILSSE